MRIELTVYADQAPLKISGTIDGRRLLYVAGDGAWRINSVSGEDQRSDEELAHPIFCCTAGWCDATQERNIGYAMIQLVHTAKILAEQDAVSLPLLAGNLYSGTGQL